MLTPRISISGLFAVAILGIASNGKSFAGAKIEPLFFDGFQVPGFRAGNVYTGGDPDSVRMDGEGRAIFQASSTDEGKRPIWTIYRAA